MTDPALSIAAPRGPVRGVALVLHGGRSRSTAPTGALQLAVLRMLPFARSLRRQGAGDGLAVARLRYRVRGWNGAERSPVADTLWALDRLSTRFPDVPIALVGHSMGGRAAFYVAAHPAVRVVVGLAPWIEPGDVQRTVAGLEGRRVLIVHGALDRMTDPTASAALARAAARSAESVSYVSVTNDKHAMLGRAAVWHRLASGFVLGALWDRSPVGTSRPGGTNDQTSDVSQVLADALAGQAALVV